MSLYTVLLLGVAFALFLGMLVLQEVGRRLGRRRAAGPEGARAGAGVIEAAVFALLGLLLAFQFARAGGRLDARRQLAVQEANAIGTAYLRLDLLPADEQPPLRDLFRRYVEARLRLLEVLPDLGAAEAELAAAQQLQGKIWTRAVAACRKQPGPAPTMLLLPALNDMIDVTTSRSVAGRTHAPLLLVALLFGVALLSAVLAGYTMSAASVQPLLHMVLFAAVTALTVYVILDLEYPRVGFIRIGAAHDALRQLRQALQ
jgi:hypothetical protein